MAIKRPGVTSITSTGKRKSPLPDRAITLNIEVSTDVAPFSPGLVRSVSNARLTPPVMPYTFPILPAPVHGPLLVDLPSPMNSRDVFAQDDVKSIHESTDRLIKQGIRWILRRC